MRAKLATGDDEEGEGGEEELGGEEAADEEEEDEAEFVGGAIAMEAVTVFFCRESPK